VVFLSPFFLFVAFLYSLIGFGGGSSYTALLVASNLVHYTEIPIISLSCNFVVVAGSLFHLKKHKNLDIKFILPFLITSIPLTYLGAQVNISKVHFLLFLGGCLFLSALKLLLFNNKEIESTKKESIPLSLLIGAILGFISGVVGIGGGIFLAPILYFLKWRKPKVIASSATIFIFINSIIGVFSHLIKAQYEIPTVGWSLIISVFIGGQLGARFCNNMSQMYITRGTGILILTISIKLLHQSLTSL